MSTPSKLVITHLALYNGTLQCTTMAPCNGTTSHPLQLYHTRMAPCNDTTSTPSKLVVTLPSPHHSTLEWHPAMAPSNHTTSTPQGWSSPSPSTTIPQLQYTTMAPYDGTQQWHHVHCTLQWNPGATSNPPKWFVALPPIGSKNPYSYRYLGNKKTQKNKKAKNNEDKIKTQKLIRKTSNSMGKGCREGSHLQIVLKTGKNPEKKQKIIRKKIQ